MKVFICGGGAYESQANAQVRKSIEEGWAELLGEDSVLSSGLDGAVDSIGSFRPQIVLCSGSYLPESTYFGEVTRAARAVSAIPVFWATEDPYEQDAHYRIVRDFDVVFSCDKWGSLFYGHPATFHLPLAGCRKRHFVEYDPAASRPIDVMFCGVAFTSRKETVRELGPALSGLRVAFVGPGWGGLGAGYTDRRIEKDELIDLYSRVKIVLNLGRSLHFENRRYMIAPSTPGPRTFEAALAGAFQVFHEDTAEMNDYFPADEVPRFSTARDFSDLLSSFLNDPEARRHSATRAQARALSSHTYAHRAEAVLNTLRTRWLR